MSTTHGAASCQSPAPWRIRIPYAIGVTTTIPKRGCIISIAGTIARSLDGSSARIALSITVVQVRRICLHSLKSTVGELGNNSIQGRGSSCCSLAAGPYNDLKACQAFGEDKERLPLAFCGAYDTVHFPMAKGQAVINMGWTAVYGKPLRCPGGLYLAGLALLTARLLRKMPVCYAGNIATVYVAV